MSFAIGDLSFWLCLFFIFGIFIASIKFNFIIAFLVIAFGFVLLAFFTKRFFLFKIFPFLLLASFLGSFYYGAYLSFLDFQKEGIKYNSFISVKAVINSEPNLTEKYLIFTATAKLGLKKIDVRIFAPPQNDFNYGDLVNVQGTIIKSDKEYEPPLLFSKNIKLISKNNGFWLREKLIDFKNSIIKNFENFLQKDNAGLLSGITLGSQASFSPEFKNDMALSGTTHLVAMSGYNITIIILAVQRIFGGILSRKKNFFISISLIMFFIIMTGLQASVIRAGITGFIALFSREIGRIFNIRNAIVFTALLMLLWNPFMITQNISFQLSFLSLLGIVYLSPVLKDFFKFENSGFLEWKDSAITTTSAQIAVLPILIINFGKFSASAIFANIAVLGVIPITMFFGFILAVLGFISYYFAFFCAKLLAVLLSYECFAIKFFANIYIPIPIHFNSMIIVFFYYAFFCFLIAKFYYKNEKR